MKMMKSNFDEIFDDGLSDNNSTIFPIQLNDYSVTGRALVLWFTVAWIIINIYYRLKVD